MKYSGIVWWKFVISSEDFFSKEISSKDKAGEE